MSTTYHPVPIANIPETDFPGMPHRKAEEMMADYLDRHAGYDAIDPEKYPLLDELPKRMISKEEAVDGLWFTACLSEGVDWGAEPKGDLVFVWCRPWCIPEKATHVFPYKISKDNRQWKYGTPMTFWWPGTSPDWSPENRSGTIALSPASYIKDDGTKHDLCLTDFEKAERAYLSFREGNAIEMSLIEQAKISL